VEGRTLDEPHQIYVQYGCGQSCPAGWLNFDVSPTLRLQRLPVIGKLLRRGRIIFPDDVRFGNIVKGLPIADGSVHGVYASHVLEHLSRADCHTALNNTFRLLKSGGIFRLIVPDLEIRAQKYLEKVRAGDAEASSWFMRNSNLGTEFREHGLVAMARRLFGNSAHLWMWDRISIRKALENAGFTEIRQCKFNDSKDQAFRLVEDRGRFHDQFVDVEECAMEAIKP